MVKIGDFIKGNLNFNGFQSRNDHYGLVVYKELFPTGYNLYVVPMSKHNKPTDKTLPVKSYEVTGNIDFSHERNSDPYLRDSKNNKIPHYSRLKLEHMNMIKVYYNNGSPIIRCNSKGQPNVYGKYKNKDVLGKFVEHFKNKLNVKEVA